MSSDDRYRVVQSIEVKRRAPMWLRRRPLLYIPLFVSVPSILWYADFPPDRTFLIATLYAALLAYWALQARRGDVGEDVERGLLKTALITTSVQTCVVVLTGGLTSPLIPVLVGPTISLLVLVGRSRAGNTMIGVTIGTAVLLALVPKRFLMPEVEWPCNVALTAVSLVFNLAVLLPTILLITDIHKRVSETLERAREDVLAASTNRGRSVEAMGARVGHELRNPLAAIKGLVQLVSRSQLDDKSRERVQVIASEVTRMEAILSDYLTFARPLDAITPRPLELSTVATDVLAVLEGRAQAAGVRLSSSGGAPLEGDPGRLKEALLNLVQNAIEACGPGGVVEVRVTASQGGAVVEVRDSGIGLSREDLAKVGTPFFTLREGGIGLGVVLARSVIHQHGGDLRYSSEPGQGTVARVELPLRPPVVEAAPRAA